jgi:hypothetical protein
VVPEEDEGVYNQQSNTNIRIQDEDDELNAAGGGGRNDRKYKFSSQDPKHQSFKRNRTIQNEIDPNSEEQKRLQEEVGGVLSPVSGISGALAA